MYLIGVKRTNRQVYTTRSTPQILVTVGCIFNEHLDVSY